LAGLALLVFATPAAASVTLGQLTNTPSGSCASADFAQLTVGAGASYQVPATGTITSWSHNATPSPGQMLTMKVLRKVTDPNIYKVIGIDGPHPLTSSLLNTFAVNIPVQAGDILDLDAANGGTGCTFTGIPADTILIKSGNLNLGDAGGFGSMTTGARLNLSAVFQPSNTVTVGTTTFNKKKGTATLNLTLPNPGTLAASGSGVSASPSGSVAAGSVQLLVKATGKKQKALNQKGKVSLSVAISFTPTNGDPGNQTVAVQLKKKTKKK